MATDKEKALRKIVKAIYYAVPYLMNVAPLEDMRKLARACEDYERAALSARARRKGGR